MLVSLRLSSLSSVYFECYPLLPFANVNSFPVSDFTAIPVNSEFSDYYGSSVTLPSL
jgi:hypothetical protein